MMAKIKNTVIIVLATLGVLFIVLMLLPDSEDVPEKPDAEMPAQAEIKYREEKENGAAEDFLAEAQADTPDETAETEFQNEEDVQSEEEPEAEAGTESEPESDEASDTEETADAKTEHPSNGATTLNIPSSDISEQKISFQTTTLDNKKVTEKIFSDYDMTLVIMWGTYCGPCIAQMGDYAALYNSLPDNINMVGIIVDVYDGLDNNVKDAEDIMSDAGAGFVNLRTSDSIYDVISWFQYTPAFILVDKEGHIIGDLHDGEGYDSATAELNRYQR